MRLGLIALLAIAGLGACATSAPEFPVSTPQGALRAYYDTYLDSELPKAPASPALDRSRAVQRVLVASCINEELDLSPVQALVRESADLTLLIGDNVYGDLDSTRHLVNNEADLIELRESYADLAASAEFKALRKERPMMTTWDDHDYGVNDGGKDFPFKEFAERIYENYFASSEAVRSRPGVYESIIAGPEGQRLQIIMTDSRFFRSDLTHSDEYGTKGKERYIPSAEPEQAMLGERQWIWLENELRKPADLRLLVSSIQIIPTVHGWEAWDKLPAERQRLFDLLKKTGASNTVFVSGDRHTAYLYKKEISGVGEVRELTASSVNSVFAKDPVSDEVDSHQLGKGYTFENYGMIDIDWANKTVGLSVHGQDGSRKIAHSFGF